VQKQAPSSAIEWFDGLLEAVYSLEQFPSRCQLAPKSKDVDTEMRQLLYKNYRIIFGVAPGGSRVDGIVQIFRIRHYAQDRLKGEDL
jgi:plasmid stabilization system protein ParE